MEASLQKYLDIIGTASELEQTTWAPHDPQLAADVREQVFMNLVQGYFLYFGGQGANPDFTPNYNTMLRLQPNPDDTYVKTAVDDDGIYRISGERGTVHLLTFTLSEATIGMAEQPGGQTAEYDLDDHIKFDKDGTFECILSAERPAGYVGNWLHLPPKTKGILIRRRAYDWAQERDPRLAIERLDLSPTSARPDAEEVDRRLTELAQYAERHTRQWLRYQDMIRDKGIVNRIEHHGFSDLGGIKVQQYWWGMYDIADDEALILETEIPEVATYWNIQLNDQIWNTLEYMWHQSHLNGAMARLDSDGKFRAVISPVDPGVPNWLDTVGRLQGTMVGRWYKCSSHPVPEIRKVKRSAIRDHLPSDTPHIGKAERDDAMRARGRAAQMRIRW